MKETEDSKEYRLAENGKLDVKFDSENAKKIINAKADYTQYFKEKDESIKKLDDALIGRDRNIGYVEPEGFRNNINRVKV